MRTLTYMNTFFLKLKNNLKSYLRLSLSLILLSLLSTLSLQAQADGYRTFTNDAGKTLRAKPVRLGPDSVILELENGRTLKSGIKFFCQADQNYLKRWDLINKAQNNEFLDIDVNRRMDRVGRDKDGAINLTYYQGYYKIKLSNKGSRPLTGIRAEYQTFGIEEAMAKQNSGDVKHKRNRGEFKVAIPPFRTQEVETSKTNLRESKLDGGYRWDVGGDKNSSAKMNGIWIRFYLEDDNTLIHEYSLPNSLMKREDW